MLYIQNKSRIRVSHTVCDTGHQVANHTKARFTYVVRMRLLPMVFYYGDCCQCGHGCAAGRQIKLILSLGRHKTYAKVLIVCSVCVITHTELSQSPARTSDRPCLVPLCSLMPLPQGPIPVEPGLDRLYECNIKLPSPQYKHNISFLNIDQTQYTITKCAVHRTFGCT